MKTAFGGVVFNAQGEVLLREPRNHYGGYVWTFAKGRQEPAETDEETALREVREETGVVAKILCRLKDGFQGDTTVTNYFIMSLVEDKGDFDPDETQAVKWVKQQQARQYIEQTTSSAGRKRDLAVLDAACENLRQLR